MSTLALPTPPTPPAPPLRQDAKLIGLVGLAHGVSHFSQLLLPPLFPWLKTAFGVSYTELGFLLTVFFVVSCVVQTLSGFWVDRHGPRPVLMLGLLCVGLAALGYAVSTAYWMLVLSAVVAGVGNGVFHPVDYTLLNRRVHKTRLGHAYSVHGITGSLGWALAPVMMVPLTLAYSWRVALVCAALVAFAVLALLVLQRAELTLPDAKDANKPAASATPTAGQANASTYGFLKLPAVWFCFAFFFFYAGALSVVQTFGPQAAGKLHAVPATWVAICVTVYMVCSACGMVLGGFLAAKPERCDRIVGVAFAAAAAVALWVALGSLLAAAVPVLFGVMGFASGIAGPSRDMLVKRATPENASGRVYGVVYSGLDIGQALVPLGVGALMDRGANSGVWLALAALQSVLIVSAFKVGQVRRPALAAA